MALPHQLTNVGNPVVDATQLMDNFNWVNQDVYNVKYYGAKGDGTTDDTTFIQNAINAAQNANGGVVYFPVGQYKVTSLSITGHSVTLLGSVEGLSPYDSGVNLVRGVQIVGTNGTNCITATGCDYFRMENLQVYLATGSTVACTAITLASCFLPRVTNCRTTNFSTGVHMTNSTDIYLDHLYISSKSVTVNPVIGVDVDGGSNQQNASVYIRDCISAHGSFTGSAYGYYLHGNRINDTFFDSCEADGCTTGFYVDGATATSGYSADIHLRACVADACVTYGFHVNGFASNAALEIVDGWSAGASTNIYVANGSVNCLISRNQVYGGSNGIYVQSGNTCVVSENQVMYQSGNCIVIDNSPRCVVQGNTGSQSTAAGSTFINLLAGSSHVTISNNIVSGGVAGGFANGIVTAASCDACSVYGNAIDSTTVTTPYNVTPSSNLNTLVAMNPGYNPVGPVTVTPSVHSYQNTSGVAVTVYVTAAATMSGTTSLALSGGAAVSVPNPTTVGISYRLMPGEKLTWGNGGGVTTDPTFVGFGD